MEHSLLSPHELNLKRGIPFHSIHHLLEGSHAGTVRFHDANLHHGNSDCSALAEINDMEKKLGRLSPEQIDMRVAVDFCCIWRYDYPDRVCEISSIIGGGCNTALRLHYQVSPARRTGLTHYADALKCWFSDKEPDGTVFPDEESRGTAEKVYRLLGRKDPLKALLAERTYLGLSARFLNCSFWGNIEQGAAVSLYPYRAQNLPGDWMKRMLEIEFKIRKEMGGAAHDFLCDVGGSAEPACHFKFIRRVDILVSSIGCLKWRGNLPPKDASIKGRRQLTQMYLDILEKYWKAEQPDSSSGDENGVERDLFERLGPIDDFKRWLVASLWKSIKNQTMFHAYPMKSWVEFVRIGESYLERLESCNSDSCA